MSISISRRTAITAGGAVLVGGCGSITGPDPRIVDAQSDAGLLDSLAGQAEVSVTVINEGADGEVVVYVELYDSAGTTLDRYGDSVYMREGERRRVTIRVNVPNGAERFQAFAEAA